MKTGFFTKYNLLVLVFSTVTVGGADADVPALTVSNNQILSGGKVESLAGNSFGTSNSGIGQEKMYNASVVKWLKDDWKSSIIRVAFSADNDGVYLEEAEDNIERIETVVDAAIANDMYVIIDCNPYHIENNKSEVIALFEQVALKYGTYNNVIYEIDSQSLQLGWREVIKPYAEDVISAIRSIDPDNLIVVGTPNGSQGVDVASQDPIMGDNIAYALHFYAGTHGQSLRDKAVMAMSNGIPLMVTQWSTANADGSGGVAGISSDDWMAFLKEHNLSHLNWAVSDKSESASIIKPGSNPEGNWVAADLTDSGVYARKAISNWSLPSRHPSGSFYPDNGDDLSIDMDSIDDLIEEIGDIGVDEDSLIDNLNDLSEEVVDTITDVSVDVDVDVDVDPVNDVDVDVDVGSIDSLDDLADEIVHVGVDVVDMTDVAVDVSVDNLVDTIGIFNEVIVDVSVDVSTETDVDVDVDVGGLVETEDLSDSLEQITSDDLVDVVDQRFK